MLGLHGVVQRFNEVVRGAACPCVVWSGEVEWGGVGWVRRSSPAHGVVWHSASIRC